MQFQKPQDRSTCVEKRTGKWCLWPCKSSIKIYKGILSSSSQKSLSLVGPDIVGDITDKLELVDHAIPVNGIALTVRSESTLGADTDLVKGSVEGDVVTIGDELSGVENTLLHLFLVLERGELAGDDTENDVLVRGEELEGLEASGARSVVLEVVGCHVQLLEQLDGDAVVTALGEVTAADEVTAAQVDTDVQVSGQASGDVIVLLDVLLEHGVGAVHVKGIFLEAIEELLGAEVWDTCQFSRS